jgi:spore coat protein U-like protein
MGVTGNVSLTPKWKVSFSTGYDFTDKEVTASQFTITRDLHCWQMSFNAIPFGSYQSYNFRINVESTILQDLKYEKKQAWQDVSF